jgi:2'-5' RNA ligase
MIRLFAAIAVPETVTEALLSLQHGVDGARWRPREALHLTLRFFGDIAEPAADELDAALAAVTGKPFPLTLHGAGAFGEGHRLNAIWAGVKESEPLRRLAGRCESAARRAGLKPDTRNYAPHVTLAYLNHPNEAEVAAWIQRHNLFAAETFTVETFGLYSSWQGRSGSSYRLERSYGLA